MPPRSEEEKLRRRALHKQKQEERRLAKEKQKEQQEELASAQNSKGQDVDKNEMKQNNNDCSNAVCHFTSLSDDTLGHLLCFLCARDLGNLSMTCRWVNYSLKENRVLHLFSRLRTTSCNFGGERVGGLKVPINMCKDEAEARLIINLSLEAGGETGRLISKKSKKSVKANLGDADEYVSYARFVEEAVSGMSVQNLGRQSILLPPIVNGRFASNSPEHSVCRIGGVGEKCGAGGSGCATWGVGKRGQLGHGKKKDENTPKMLIGGLGSSIRIVQVSAGGGLVRVAHTLLLTSNGKVLSFGTGQYGALGHGYGPGKTLPDATRPQFIEALSHLHVTCVSAGELHSAVVTSDGDLYSFGDGFCGQLGHGDKRPQLEPKQVTAGNLEDECILSVSCGARHTLCVTEEGETFSFGLGHFKVLGRSYSPYEYYAQAALANMGTEEELQNVPIMEAVNAQFRLDNEQLHQLDLLANLTLDDRSDQCYPKIVDALKGIKIVGVSAGHRHSMFLDNEGSVYTCGTGRGGALGHGDNETQEFPMKVLEFDNIGINIMQISAGVDISMAASTTGEVYSWGTTKGGRIGLESTAPEVLVPRHVQLPENEKGIDVECGYVHSLIIGVSGAVYQCGGVGTDGEEDGERIEHGMSHGTPHQLPNFNIWHRIPEPKEIKQAEKWKKYGKYELKGRTAMMAESEKWGV